MGKKIIRIAQIIGRTLNGGVENLIYNYYLNIDRTKVQYDFFIEEESKIINKENIGKLGGNIHIIPSYKHYFKYKKKLKEIFSQNEYDIVQANMNSLSFISLKVAMKQGVKVRICNSLSTSNKKEKLHHIIKSVFRKFSKKYATHYFACSDLCGTWLYGYKIKESPNYYKINNAIQIENYYYNAAYNEELRKKYNLNDNLVIGTIGRLEVQKNHLFLIEIFSEIVKINDKSVLFIIGDGALKQSIVEKAEKLKIKDKIFILTSKEVGVRMDALKYYSLFDVFVLPSLYEGLPTVGIEAQINNLPCYFSDTITRETQITENCSFIGLEETPKFWAEKIMQYQAGNRMDYKEYLEYDVKEQSKELLRLYDKFKKESSDIK